MQSYFLKKKTKHPNKKKGGGGFDIPIVYLLLPQLTKNNNKTMLYVDCFELAWLVVLVWVEDILRVDKFIKRNIISPLYIHTSKFRFQNLYVPIISIYRGYIRKSQ
jgi:hypothetical protein